MDDPVESATTMPRWLREVDGSLAVNSQFVLSGNIHDRYLVNTSGPPGPPPLLLEALWSCLARRGFNAALVYDPVDQLFVHPVAHPDARSAVVQALGGDLPRECSLPRLAELVRQIVQPSPLPAGTATPRIAVVIDYASRLALRPQDLSPEERTFFVAMEKFSHVAQPIATAEQSIYNPVFWIVVQDRDLPAWLTAGNETIRLTPIPLPDLEDRRTAAKRLAVLFPGFRELDEDGRAVLIARFAGQTEGMSVKSMVEITRLAMDRGFGPADIEDAVRCYRVGILENPWKKPQLRESIRTADEVLGQRVFGQAAAVQKVTDILIRSTTGLTGAQSGGSVTRPRGVLFFAGPTGVGKTELAKAVTEMVFGDERAYTRFDMSEFSAEHADARLIGAPPGYVGFDAGGELTNAVREKPFSLVLFDEIEKAHPRILDKFLQVLEDGRLTDGTGSTVHFSETILVFTSNLGIYRDGTDEHGNVTREVTVKPDTPRDKLEQILRAEIAEYFTLRLNRPELLNRLGDNIVVFNFIEDEVAGQIFEHQLRNIVQRVERELAVTLVIDPMVQATLLGWATSDLSMGGRGIGSVLESSFVNPLARALFPALFPDPPPPGTTLTVSAISRTDTGVEVDLV